MYGIVGILEASVNAINEAGGVYRDVNSGLSELGSDIPGKYYAEENADSFAAVFEAIASASSLPYPADVEKIYATVAFACACAGEAPLPSRCESQSTAVLAEAIKGTCVSVSA